MEFKVCSKCKANRPIQDFYKHGTGRRPDCKQCCKHRVRMHSQTEEYKERARNRSKAWREEHRDYCREMARNWRSTTLRGYFNKKLTTTRANSRRLNRECSIGAAYLEELYNRQGGKCAITGRTMVIGPSYSERDALSLDRINPQRGYVEGNVRLVTWQVNCARGVWTDDDLLSLAVDVLKGMRGTD
jgi:hypothetical protein